MDRRRGRGLRVLDRAHAEFEQGENRENDELEWTSSADVWNCGKPAVSEYEVVCYLTSSLFAGADDLRTRREVPSSQGPKHPFTSGAFQTSRPLCLQYFSPTI